MQLGLFSICPTGLSISAFWFDWFSELIDYVHHCIDEYNWIHSIFLLFSSEKQNKLFESIYLIMIMWVRKACWILIIHRCCRILPWCAKASTFCVFVCKKWAMFSFWYCQLICIFNDFYILQFLDLTDWRAWGWRSLLWLVVKSHPFKIYIHFHYCKYAPSWSLGFSGCHRYEAHQRLGLPTIRCKVRRGTKETLR
jgi:hypothetical protein